MLGVLRPATVAQSMGHFSAHLASTLSSHLGRMGRHEKAIHLQIKPRPDLARETVYNEVGGSVFESAVPYITDKHGVKSSWTVRQAAAT